MLDARIKAAEEELDAKQKDANALPGREAADWLSKQEIALRDVMADRMIEDSPEVRRQKSVIAAKRSRLAATEQVVAKGSGRRSYDRLADEIQSDEQVARSDCGRR